MPTIFPFSKLYKLDVNYKPIYYVFFLMKIPFYVREFDVTTWRLNTHLARHLMLNFSFKKSTISGLHIKT